MWIPGTTILIPVKAISYLLLTLTLGTLIGYQIKQEPKIYTNNTQSITNLRSLSGSALLSGQGALIGEISPDSDRITGVAIGENQVILKASQDMQDNASTASGWMLSKNGLNQSKILLDIGKLFGVIGTSETKQRNKLILGNFTGTEATAWINEDNLLSFGAYDPSKSPNLCSLTKGCDQSKFTQPDLNQALLDTKNFHRSLGLDINSFTWTASYEGESNVRVTSTLTLDGYQLPLYWLTDISSLGIYSVNSFAANPVEVPDYPIIGARSTLERTNLSRWSAVGPNPVWLPKSASQKSQEDDPTFDQQSNAKPYTSPRIDGRPLLSLPVKTLNVSDPKLGLSLYAYASGEILFLPSWEYLAEDNTRWSMLALDERYVTFEIK